MKASRKALLVGLMMAASALTAPAIVSAGIILDVDVAPPPVRVETIPVVEPGYVWAPGYWEWQGGQHVWIPGRRIRERHGYHWVPDHWDQRGPRWHHERGHWER